MVAAFTSQTVSITARVDQPPIITSYPLDPAPLTQAEVDAMTQDAIGVSGCQPGDLEFPYEATTGACAWWALRIGVRNNYYDPLIDLTVEDTFVGKVDGMLLPEVPVKVRLLAVSLGDAQQTASLDRVQIDWCVTGPLQDGGCTGGGQLEPGLDAYVDLLVFTQLNLQGQQEFTAAGTYTLDEGPRARWVDPSGVICAPLAECPMAQPVTVEAVSDGIELSEPAEMPTPTPTPTPAPTSTPTPAPTPAPTSTPTPAPTPSPATTPTPTPIS